RYAMSKTKATAKSDKQEELKAPETAASGADQQAQTPKSAPTATDAAPTPEPEAATTPPPTETKSPEKGSKAVTARVLCAGIVGDQRFEAGAVVKGMRAEAAQAHASMLDTHPAAISHAIDGGAQVLAWKE